MCSSRVRMAGTGWEMPQTESPWVLNTHLWEKVPFKIPPWAASWSQRLAKIQALVLWEVPVHPLTQTHCMFLWGPELLSLSLQPLEALREQWDILHPQANGVWRRTPMNTGHNFWGRRAEAFLQGWTQEGQPGDDWLLRQIPGHSLTAFLLKALRRQQLKPVNSRR